MRRDKDPGSSPSEVGPWVYSVEPLFLGLPGMLYEALPSLLLTSRSRKFLPLLYAVTQGWKTMLGCLILILLKVPLAKEAAFLAVSENGMTKGITPLLAGDGTVFIPVGVIDLTFICHLRSRSRRLTLSTSLSEETGKVSRKYTFRCSIWHSLPLKWIPTGVGLFKRTFDKCTLIRSLKLIPVSPM